MADKAHRPVVNKVEGEKVVVAEYIEQVIIHEGTTPLPVANRFDFVKKLSVWFMGFVVFITTMVGFIRLWEDGMGLVTIVLLAVGGGSGTLGCAYLAFSRTQLKRRKSKKGRKRETWKYSRWRSWALSGLIVIPLITTGGIGYYFYQKAQPPDKVIILVADFDGPKSQEYRVTEIMLARLRAALEPYDDVQVEALGRAIVEVEGSAIAHTEGEKRKAAIVIWGWYGVTSEAVSLSVHFEVLRSPELSELLAAEAKGLVQTMTIAELESFALQTSLSNEMTYLSLFSVGMTRYTSGDWDSAITCFSDVLGLVAEHTSALNQNIIHFSRGNAYISKGDYDRAVADYDQAIKLQPDFAKAYNNRACAYIIRGDYDYAIIDLNQAIQLQPDSATEAYNNRGFIYTTKGNYNHAIADINQAIHLQPDLAVAYINRGNAYLSKGDYSQSIANYDQAVKLQPDLTAMGYMNRAIIFSLEGNYDQAIVYLDKAIRLQPDLAEIYINRGNVNRKMSNYDQAIADLGQAIELQPNNARAYYGRAKVYFDKSNYDRAIVDFSQAIQLKPDYTNAYYGLGKTYFDKGDYAQAIIIYDQLTELEPNYTNAYYDRGFAYMRNGEKEKAIADFNIFLELSNDPYWRQQAQGLLWALEQVTEPK